MAVNVLRYKYFKPCNLNMWALRITNIHTSQRPEYINYSV